MTKLFPLACCLFLSTGLIHAQQWVNKKHSYDSTLNIVYGTATNFNGGIDTLKMDIYTPVCLDPVISSRPLLVWIHGGAFLAGSKDEPGITRLCKEFARRGYVTASISYRLGMVSDDIAWACNFPNYSCVLATDTAECYRALYRGIQDGKGAVRYLVNRHAQYQIDTANVFVAGESAGAFIALGIALLDTLAERLPHTYAWADAPKPHPGTANCQYNQNKTFANTIPRPDLGGIDGTIEPSSIDYTIKGIGNMYGAVSNDILKLHKANTPKPAIYSFHQPCDIVVPIDSGRVYAGLTWCLANCYSCYGIANTPIVYGSRIISNWNTANNYGYTMHNEFTGTAFPYNCLFGTGSCLDQTNNPCHAYDSQVVRENNLAAFFAGYVSSSPTCNQSSGVNSNALDQTVRIYPNPSSTAFNIVFENDLVYDLKISDALGRIVFSEYDISTRKKEVRLDGNANGVYYVLIHSRNGQLVSRLVLKN